jgi:hypothetical protein
VIAILAGVFEDLLLGAIAIVQVMRILRLMNEAIGDLIILCKNWESNFFFATNSNFDSLGKCVFFG